MKKIPPLTKKRRSLAEISPDSLAAALYHRELAELLKTCVNPKLSICISDLTGQHALVDNSEQTSN